ncbi:hypothetical protein N7467_001574 [Penicillium canescens]|nr:hypothetical protein N7467_001574 [Penicillium canescens]
MLSSYVIRALIRAEIRGLLCLANGSTSVSSAIRYTIVTSNPIAIARFFYYIYKAVLNGLLGTYTDKKAALDNAIARTRQLYSKRYIITYFKYRQLGSAYDSYRFSIPRDLLEASKVDKYGIIHLTRNNT